MPDRPRLAAAGRTVTGKAVARLRREGRLPAVVAGHGVPSRSLSVDAHEFELLRKHAGATTLVDLAVEGERPLPVLVQGVQVHPLSRRPVHVDLLAVRMSEELTVDVALVPSGHAPASDEGGTVVHDLTSVRVKALPGDLPEQLAYDVSGLADTSSTVTVADLRAPRGVTVLTDPAEVVARVLPPRVEEEPVVAEAAEGAEAAAEGAEAAGGGGTTAEA